LGFHQKPQIFLKIEKFLKNLIKISTKFSAMAWLITPAVLLNGMGGILYIFTGFQLANFFPAGRSTVCALLIGSYNASAIVYPLLFLAFDNGILSFRGCMLFHFFLAVASFVEGWLDTPVEPIPEPGSENRPIDDEKDEEKKESASDGKRV